MNNSVLRVWQQHDLPKIMAANYLPHRPAPTLKHTLQSDPQRFPEKTYLRISAPSQLDNSRNRHPPPDPNESHPMKIHIKNMVCARCKMVVKSELENLGLHPVSVELGEVEIGETKIDDIKPELLRRLRSLGFDLIDDKKRRIVEKIKNLIIDLVQRKDNEINIKLSAYLSDKLNRDYSTLSNLFSESEGTTIEKYFINLKIEKVKELLIYDELSLKEIAYRLNYSSPAHLSNQFKSVTGFSPSYFKRLKDKKRRQIEDL